MRNGKLSVPPTPEQPPVFTFRRVNWRPLLIRTLTGLSLILVITGLVLLGAFGFLTLLLLINGLSLLEFYRLFGARSVQPQQRAGQLLAATLLITSFLVLKGEVPPTGLLITIPMVFSIFVFQIYSSTPDPFGDLAFTFLGILYITLPLAFCSGAGFIPPGQGGYHPEIILGYFCLLWASDTGAFLMGNLFGRHYLFKRISPHKTWEGSVGGLLCTLTVAALSYRLVGVSRLHWFVIAGLVVVTGTYGDLIKSLMKRSLGVKDAGSILPGHGGILDRFDSLLGSAPWVFAYLLLFQKT